MNVNYLPCDGDRCEEKPVVSARSQVSCGGALLVPSRSIEGTQTGTLCRSVELAKEFPRLLVFANKSVLFFVI